MNKMKIPCVDCKTNKSVVSFSESGILELMHGWGKVIRLCRNCYINRLEEQVKKIKNNITEQKELMKIESRKRAKT